jgi:hypothetical protein
MDEAFDGVVDVCGRNQLREVEVPGLAEDAVEVRGGRVRRT